MSLIIKLFLLFLVAPFAYKLLPLLLQIKRKNSFYFFVLFHAALLSVAVLTFLNLPVTILSDQISFLSFGQKISSSQNRDAYKFVKDNFLLIDNAFDKQLISKPDQTQGDSSFIPITDRRKLTTFFNLLADDSSHIDLVICDIGFDDTTRSDTLLSKALLRLYRQKKLLVSVSGELSKNELFKFPATISGDVKEETNEKLFTTHRLKRYNFYSLPFQVHTYLNQVINSSSWLFNTVLEETSSKGKSQWKMNTFLPQFFITNEALLKNDLEGFPENKLITDDMDSVDTNTILLRTLGNSISELGEEDFLLNLAQRRSHNKKNIVIIGTFSGTEDIHKTAYTDLHGPTILLNLIYSLESGQNRISAFLVIILIVFFFFISLTLFNRVRKKISGSYEKNEQIMPRWYNKKWLIEIHDRGRKFEKKIKRNIFMKFFLLIIEFIIVEELPYFLLLIMVIFLYHFSGVVINGISLAAYLIAFETFAVYFGKSVLQTKSLEVKK